jgi:hypothetical protein
MITTIVDAHVGFVWHMTLHALSPLASQLMKVMIRRIEPSRIFLIGNMTSGAELIGIRMQFHRMGIMTIDTADSLMEHLALNIGTIDINFVINLPINMISWHLHVRRPGLYNFGKKVIEKRIISMMSGVNESTTGMTFCT